MSVVLCALAMRCEGQARSFWVLDGVRREVSHRAPGLPASSGLVLSGMPRRVRATPAGRGVLADGWGSTVWLLGQASITQGTVAGRVTDAAPDGAGGAWVLSRSGPMSFLSRMDASGVASLRRTIPALAVLVTRVRDGWVLVTTRSQGVFRTLLLDAAGTRELDVLESPGWPSDLVPTNDAGLIMRGAVANALTLIRVTASGSIVVEGFVPIAEPVVAVAPVPWGDELMVIDGAPPRLRLIDRAGGEIWSLSVTGAAALETLPEGDVLVHQPGAASAMRVDRGGFGAWVGPWPASVMRPEGAGMEYARLTPDDDPDGDGFPNRDELAIGSDPGNARSAPLAAWREGGALRLRAVDPAVAFYVAVASQALAVGTTPAMCASGPFLYASLTPGVCFEAPIGVLESGEADVVFSAGLAGDPFVAVAGYDLGWVPRHVLGARAVSAW